MIKKVAGWFLEKLIGWMDRKNGQMDARSFVEQYYKKFLEKTSLMSKTRKDLQELEMIMVRLGWLKQVTLSDGLEKQAHEISGDWLAQLKNHQIIHKGILAAGTGRYLDRLDELPKSKYHALVSATMEDLLRHAEVKREKSFGKFTPNLSDDQIELEKHDISILFSRAARRHSDLRFLNAALKLNDWRMRHYQHPVMDENLVRFLLALAEQELGIKELLV